MYFPSKVDYYGYAVLRHDSVNNKSFMYFIDHRLSRQNVDEKVIKETIEAYKLIFCNHFVETSHFVNFISNNVIASNFKPLFYHYLLMYVKQFYPELELTKSTHDEKSLEVLFNSCYEGMNNIFGQFYEEYDINQLRRNTDKINKIFKFYDAIEDFMIRFYDYSIIGISKQKYIITSSNNCDKKFIDQLMDGYSLFRLQKVGIVQSHFEFQPVFPTKDVGFPIEEFIEISGNDNKLESKRLVKMR